MPSNTMPIASYLAEKKEVLDIHLKKIFGTKIHDLQHLVDTIHYSLLANGKRIRPILCLATYEAFGNDSMNAIQIASSLELIHCYSLIQDDLPCMDDDDLRRGQPTNHKKFGEAGALLASDALQTESFNQIASCPYFSTDIKNECIKILSYASGYHGMVGGQVLDLIYQGKDITLEKLQTLHTLKTGKLIEASILVGATLAGQDAKTKEHLAHFGQSIGLAFQIKDDVLDIEGGDKIGKDQKSDIAKDKTTFPKVLGLEASKREFEKQRAIAIDSLRKINANTSILEKIAEFIIQRDH